MRRVLIVDEGTEITDKLAAEWDVTEICVGLPTSLALLAPAKAAPPYVIEEPDPPMPEVGITPTDGERLAAIEAALIERDVITAADVDAKLAELAALLVEKGVATEAEVVAKLERADVAEVKPR